MAKKPSKTEQSEQELNAQAERIYKVFQATKTRSTSASTPSKTAPSEREVNEQAARYYLNYQATKLHVAARREPTAESRDFVRRLAERLQEY